MRRIVLLAVLLIGLSWVQAQIPAGYYDGTDGLYREALHSKLHQIIKGNKVFTYGDARYILDETDRDPNKSSNIILVYGGYSVSSTWDYGNTWNREHVWAKSHGDFGTDDGPGSDLHNLKPADATINEDRSNKDFDEGGWQESDYSPPAGYSKPYKTDCYTNDQTWEPRDEVKGDIARIIFYMDVRYDGDDGFPDLQVVDKVPSITAITPNQPYHGKLSTLLRWNEEDPPDDFERNRNDVIYSYQNNRNPFIDHPEFVNAIWGENAAVDQLEKSTDRVYYSRGNVVCENNSIESKSLQVFNLAGKQIYNSSVAAGKTADIPTSGFPVLVIVKLGAKATKVVID
ncbi:endonuclease I family protein [Saccharicrinis sp. FJH62]|uniref:endonuclease I family protein n=1 Tax=Saccharicrinis sp. FJH62 TaxID=3344657 RepID=UPI0035D436F6